MKAQNFTKLALLGVTSGLIALSQPGAEAALDINSTNVEHLLAGKCASHGCGGEGKLTAEAKVVKSADDQDADDGDDSDDDYDDEDEDATEDEGTDSKEAAKTPPKPAAK